ncbi:MAG: Translation factor SUA5 [Candidatus Uhrbacteria bacterium GW2011_GWF2_41_16]|uniref:L-threonylcarbamoyladenylate synthase n=2 Tax=Candidatus Uhriibacteriota TaxID=1752732 RepID=A0A0G0YEF6_9BACT|nr:MAG: Translation factor SUA5 [Candidatus Uhrbacteria bacterium GW2011_GWA2_41_10]KKR87758.1 MAG: Translation factor SUA5 [Candidatus Uhrbacteria bacterium GW2011_GWC2_41_11]KKR98697.1 MAG: Translation factor SUA5 [Candidatus Uhrbacteria bacterium GW2011_GWF2_41_16]HBP00207.1 threonylcarbamoyl-AMP synthase [Candidatus Uhrbacteria bacterium]
MTDHALRILSLGGVVAFPTETAYALGADATNDSAVERIFLIKGREEEKTVPLIASSLEMVERYAILSQTLQQLANQYWPGPLTLILPVRDNHHLAPQVVRMNGTIAIRVSSHPLVHDWSQKLGVPIVSTSANRSGEPTCYSINEVKQSFLNKVYQPDFFWDGGILPIRKPSTIIMEKEGKIVVLRQGEIFVSLF